MGFFSGLNAEKYDRQYSDMALVKRIYPFIKRQRLRIVLLTLTVLVLSGAGALQPIIVAKGVDKLNSQITLTTVFIIPLLVLCAGVIGWVANWAQRRLSMRAIGDIVMDLATTAYRAAIQHDLSFYDEMSSGRVVSRITSDTQEFGTMIQLLTDVLAQIVEGIILGIVMLQINATLTFYLIAMMPMVFVFTILYRRLMRRVVRRGFRAMANVNAAVKETISGISIAKNFRQERTIYDEFTDANKTSFKVNFQRGMVVSSVFPIMNALAGLATALMVYSGGMSVSKGIVSFGAWYLFILGLDRFLYPMMNIASFWTQIQNGFSAAERTFALIEAKSAVTQDKSDLKTTLHGKIEFERVRFAYRDNEPVLDDFNLTIQPGENLAIVGQTGAGKSSIARLVARFYEFQSGRILLDDIDIRSFNLENYRRQLGIVSQVPFLFSGTIEENIQYTSTSALTNDILAVVRRIGEGEWLDALPNGLSTEVGERGSRLSTGQRQLVALIRVLVQQPAVFILDEATASIDPFTEKQIQRAINLILARSTSILIAHRLSTVKSADRIIVLEKGKIIEEGTHLQLMKAGSSYASLYNAYFRHQSLEYVEDMGQYAHGKS
ncbi:MAG: ABC transporter ATP-binding protein [Anaerolineaceae bacterium]